MDTDRLTVSVAMLLEDASEKKSAPKDMTLSSKLYTAYFFISSAILVWISAVICLFTAPFDPNRKLVHMYSCWWGFHYVALNPRWNCTFEGLENIRKDKTYVLVANHQSYWDIMVLYGLYRPYKWVSKEDIFKMPFIGWNMYFNQYVKISRGELKSIKQMMADCKAWLNNGASIMIFPEGTRSEDGELQQFRDGPFKLACDCNVEVVPIVIDGTHKVLPKGSPNLDFSTKISVRVLPAVNPNDFEKKPRAIREHVKEQMAIALKEIRSASASDSKALALQD